MTSWANHEKNCTAESLNQVQESRKHWINNQSSAKTKIMTDAQCDPLGSIVSNTGGSKKTPRQKLKAKCSS